MAFDKKKKLHALKEVEELHPLLHKLFEKMPGIAYVEYRHGAAEIGADFIVAKEDKTFGKQDYIGVVVKAQKIAQDHGDVKRQIEECYVPRVVRGGKEKIRVQEVWVVTSHNITRNAQDIIHDSFQKNKITFLQDDDLVRLIDTYYSNYWFDIPLETNDYLKNLRTKNDEIDKSCSLIQVGAHGFYIEQDIYKCDSNEYGRKLKHARDLKIDIYGEVATNRTLIVEGGMGAGKSKLLRKLVDHYTTPEVFLVDKVVPVSVSYKELCDSYHSSLVEVLDGRVGQRAIDEIGVGAKYLFLIDGVDEKDLSPKDQIENLKKVIQEVNAASNFKAVITTRPLECIEQDFDVKKETFQYELRPLTLQKTIEFLVKLCEYVNIKKRIIEDLKKSQLFKELPKSPISAILLAKIINENEKDIPSNMTELYSKYMEMSLGRWDIEKGLQSQKEYQALDNIIMNLARFMIENEITSVSLGEVERMFVEYLSERNLGINEKELLKQLIGRCDIVVVNQDKTVLTFKHRTFAEYFYAKSLIRDNTAKISEAIFSPYWINTYFFYLGLKRDSASDLEAIINLSPATEHERWMKMINMANFFLAAYTSPYKTISNGVRRTMMDTADLYRSVINGESKSPFRDLPRMHVLYLIQYLIRQNYSYEFLKKAIEDSALSIGSDDGTDSETRAYALFFLSVAYIELGSQNFNFLLEACKEALPFDVQLAVKHETEYLKSPNELIRRQNKRLSKMLKGNGSLISMMKSFYEPPAKKLA